MDRGLIAALCLALASCADPAADKAALNNHCQMVNLWESTAGDLGWPDYNNTAHLCPNNAGTPGKEK